MSLSTWVEHYACCCGIEPESANDLVDFSNGDLMPHLWLDPLQDLKRGQLRVRPIRSIGEMHDLIQALGPQQPGDALSPFHALQHMEMEAANEGSIHNCLALCAYNSKREPIGYIALRRALTGTPEFCAETMPNEDVFPFSPGADINAIYHLYVDAVYVRPEHRNRNIGYKLAGVANMLIEEDLERVSIDLEKYGHPVQFAINVSADIESEAGKRVADQIAFACIAFRDEFKDRVGNPVFVSVQDVDEEIG